MKRNVFLMRTLPVAFLLFLVFLVPAMSEPEKNAGEQEDLICATCHADAVKAFATNPHASNVGVCKNCHVTVDEHLNSPSQETMFAFEDTELVKTRNDVCQSCHQKTHPQFAASPHAKAGLACTSCHDIHEGSPARALMTAETTSETCRDCHADVFSKFSLNEHHRLEEGVLECTSCHNPHEPQTRASLGGFKQAECLKCHTDKQGPYIFEHGSVLVEGCVSCHEPHGTVNRHQLVNQKVANLCFSCHAVAPSFHTRLTAETNCTNCHAAIHGSNTSAFFLNF